MHSSKSSKKSPSIFSTLLALIVGIVLGVNVGKNFNGLTANRSMQTVTESSVSITDNTKDEESQALPVDHHKRNGFNPIYVYYGADEAIDRIDEFSPPPNGFQSYGQLNQDLIVSALYKTYSSRNGIEGNTPYFLDLAANDAIRLSNTAKLEQDGWRGLCVEPNPIYWYRLAHRKCHVLGAFVGGNIDMQEVDVSLSNHVFGGIIGKGLDNKGSAKPLKRYTVSLKTVFEKFDVPTTIDYMSLDVEGAESIVMNDFPFHSYKILFFSIERPKADLVTLLKNNGYKHVLRIGKFGETLWVHETVNIVAEEIFNIANNQTSQALWTPPQE